MFKALGVFILGLLAACGLGYYFVRKQEDQTLRKQIDAGIAKIGASFNAQAKRVADVFTASDSEGIKAS